MKKIFIAMLSVVALAACSQDEVTDIQREYIDFNPTTKNSVRTAPVTTANLSSFYVWGYSSQGNAIMEAQEVTSDGSAWTYSPKKYWPMDGTVDFYALYPTSVTGTPAHTLTPTVSLDGASVYFRAAESSGMSGDYIAAETVPDLVYATAIDMSKGNTNGADGKVLVKMQHAMSQIAFKLKNNTTADLGITVESSNVIYLYGLYYDGTYTLPAESTSNEGVKGSWARGLKDTQLCLFPTTMGVVAETGADAVLISDADDACFVLPQNLDIEFGVVCTIKQNGVSIFSGVKRVSTTVNWQEGYKYTYTFIIDDDTIEDDAIEFTAEVTPIEEATGEELGL